ncbi:MAG: hypothetical protein ACI8Y8_001134 [Planctomycetota bacterium]|jgi:hypothetical protein
MKLMGALLVAVAAWFPSIVDDRWSGPTWLGDIDEAFALALEKDRPLLIVFR